MVSLADALADHGLSLDDLREALQAITSLADTQPPLQRASDAWARHADNTSGLADQFADLDDAVAGDVAELRRLHRTLAAVARDQRRLARRCHELAAAQQAAIDLAEQLLDNEGRQQTS